jgi:7-carboxy-7-deazaguanine synthase
MKVSEIFHSMQGEGFLAGTPSVFVRLSGCPLNCRWCDTKYAGSSKSGTDYTIEEIIEEVEKWNCRSVVISGGEPMVNPGLLQLAARLKMNNKHITIETAGIAFVPDLACDLMSISPKLSNSIPPQPRLAEAHNKLRLNFPVLRQLMETYNYQLKFVVDSVEDLPEVHQTIEKIGNVDTKKVLLMLQAATKDKYLLKLPMAAQMCEKAGFAFSPRLQVLLWNNARGM